MRRLGLQSLIRTVTRNPAQAESGKEKGKEGERLLACVLCPQSHHLPLLPSSPQAGTGLSASPEMWDPSGETCPCPSLRLCEPEMLLTNLCKEMKSQALGVGWVVGCFPSSVPFAEKQGLKKQLKV